MQFEDIPKLNPLPVVQMSKETAKEMREWAMAFGKTVKQWNVRQETCSYKAGTLPLYAYEKQQENTDTVDFAWDECEHESDDIDTEYSTDSEDIDSNTSDEVSGGSDDDTEVINPVLHFLMNTRQNTAKGRKG